MDCATCERLRDSLDRARRAYAKVLQMLASFATSGDVHELTHIRAEVKLAEMNFQRLTEEWRRHQTQDHAAGERASTATS